MRTIVARWESRGGKCFRELYRDEYGYGYTGDDCGGFLGKMESDAVAIAAMESGPAAVLRGYRKTTRRTK
jgi:hypothetical protein